jgi:hypothetical protein
LSWMQVQDQAVRWLSAQDEGKDRQPGGMTA